MVSDRAKKCIYGGILLLAIAFIIIGSGCTSKSSDNKQASTESGSGNGNGGSSEPISYKPTDTFITSEETVNESVGNDIIYKYFTNNVSTEEKSTYLIIATPNEDLGNKLSINGTVTYDVCKGTNIPQYKATLNLTSNGRDVTYDTIVACYQTEQYSYTILGKESRNGKSGRVLSMGQHDEFSVDTSNILNNLLVNSTNMKTGLHISIYNGNVKVASFHTILPTDREFGGKPAEITLQQTQPLNFTDIYAVTNALNASYMDGLSQNNDELMKQRDELNRNISFRICELNHDNYNNRLAVSGTVSHDLGASGQEQYDLKLNVSGEMGNVSYNMAQAVFLAGNEKDTFLRFYTVNPNEQKIVMRDAYPGCSPEFFRFETDNSTSRLLEDAPGKKVAVHLSFNKNNEIVDSFHIILPTIVPNGGQPAQLALGETQELKFCTYRNAEDYIGLSY